MNFSSRKDLVYACAIWCLPLFLITWLIFSYSLAMLIIFVSSVFLSFWLWNSTNYKIENGELYIKCWILRKRVNIQNILKIRKTNNLLSSYALSCERLEITEKKRYGKYYVSPDNFNLFIDELKKNNSDIVVN